MNKSKDLARFEGPVYGVALIHLAENHQPYVVHAFNTASAVKFGGYVEGQYHLLFFDTFEEAVEDFQRRVSSGLRDVRRQAREMEKKIGTKTGRPHLIRRKAREQRRTKLMSKAAHEWSDEEIARYFDMNPNLSLGELARMTRKGAKELKRILMS